MAHSNLEKMLATKQANEKARADLIIKVRELKLSNLSKIQTEKIERTLLEAKWVSNEILSMGVREWQNRKTVIVKTPDGLEERKLTIIHAHVKQNIHRQLKSNIKALSASKKRGKKVGALKFKTRVNAVEYSSGDVRWDSNNHIFIPKLGWLRASGCHQLQDSQLANARLVRRASGYYLLVTTYTKIKLQKDLLPAIGIDLGIKNHLTLSDNREFNTLIEETERLKRLQRKLKRQVKGSNNHWKTRVLLQKEYEKLNHRKDDAAKKLVHELLKHEKIVFQDDNLNNWKLRYGKTIQHSILGRVKSLLKKQNSDQVVILDQWLATTSTCVCGIKTQHKLAKRIFICSACGYSQARDLHAAENMLRFAGISFSGQGLPIALVDQETTAEASSSVLVSPIGLKQETSDIKSTSALIVV